MKIVSKEINRYCAKKQGVMYKGVFAELPNQSNGTFVLEESLRTNEYGYYDNGGVDYCWTSLDSWNNQAGRSVTEAIKVVEIINNKCAFFDPKKYARLNFLVYRKQGA